MATKNLDSIKEFIAEVNNKYPEDWRVWYNFKTTSYCVVSNKSNHYLVSKAGYDYVGTVGWYKVLLKELV